MQHSVAELLLPQTLVQEGAYSCLNVGHAQDLIYVWSGLGVFLQECRHQFPTSRRQVQGHWFEDSTNDLQHQPVEIFGVEWALERAHFVENHTKAPDVTFVVVRLAFANFWREVVRRANRGACVLVGVLQNPRNSKIAQLDQLFAPRQEDVLGLEVTVQDFAIVQVLERETYLDEPIGDAVLRKQLAALRLETPGQVAAVSVRHDDTQLSLFFEAFAVLDDVGVAQRAENRALLARSCPLLLIAARNVHHLDHKLLVTFVASGKKRLSKGTLAEELAPAVVADRD